MKVCIGDGKRMFISVYNDKNPKTGDKDNFEVPKMTLIPVGDVS
jgi:hypothetical protein